MANIILLIVTWIHVFSVIIWLGGVIMLEFFIFPALLKSQALNLNDFMMKIIKEASAIFLISNILVLFSGLYLAHADLFFETNNLFHTSSGNLLIVKVILYVIFSGIGGRIGIILSKINPSTPKEEILLIVNKTKKLVYIMIILAMIIVFMGITLRYGTNITI